MILFLTCAISESDVKVIMQMQIEVIGYIVEFDTFINILNQSGQILLRQTLKGQWLRSRCIEYQMTTSLTMQVKQR